MKMTMGMIKIIKMIYDKDDDDDELWATMHK